MSFRIRPHKTADFYKLGHAPMYIEGTTSGYNNFTPRSSRLASKLAGIFEDKVVVGGLQGFIKWYLIDTWNNEFFNRPKAEVVQEYIDCEKNGLCIDKPDTSRVEALHDLGYLPLSIKALPEGSLVDIKVPYFTIASTHPDFAWLPNFGESVISAEIWKTCTTATTAYQYRKLLDQYAESTGSPKEFVLWQGHDFSFRGQSGLHDAASSGIGHLFSFLGTDTIPAMDYVEDYYRGKETFVGGSVPASEHSVASLAIVKITKELERGSYKGITTLDWIDELESGYSQATGKRVKDDVITIPLVAEYIAAKRLMTEVFPSGVLSYVADTFDYWSVITVILPALKKYILERPVNAIGLSKVVARPDSGDPADIICGRQYKDMSEYDNWSDHDFSVSGEVYDDLNKSGVLFRKGKFHEYETDWEDMGYGYATYNTVVKYEKEVPMYEIKGSIDCLFDVFGGTVTDKGFKLLDSHIGLIYGDSITLERAQNILKRLADNGYASGNVVFGIGSFTYQYQTRDSFGWAMKATHAVVDGEGIDIYKDPKTDNGTKKSAKGLLRVEYEDGKFVLYDQQTPEQEKQGCLVEVFRDGKLLVDQSLAEIRTRLHG